jgi:hypothetical protein
VEGGGGGLTVSGVSRNRGGFVKCVAIQKRLGIPAIDIDESWFRSQIVLKCSIIKSHQQSHTLLLLSLFERNIVSLSHIL